MIERVNEDTGLKEYVLTEEEKVAQEQSIAAKEAEVASAKKLAEERGENFSKFNEKVEKLEGELKTTRQTLEEKATRERDDAKTNFGMKFYGTNAELKATLEGKYAVLSGMPESNPQEIAARMTEAAKLAGINVGSQNPIYTPVYGEAPAPKAPAAKADEFLKSERGVAAQKAMGLEPEAAK